nr:immunoglobulin light chain junction region [Macaca mulatta]MOW54267.1 immunoglobulin light chain junction region [Macaca mulatta]MOX99013.1 immunoglobulin light chain junction region [Macaca mulatta]
CMHPLEFPWTF